MKKIAALLCCLLMSLTSLVLRAEVRVTDVQVKPRLPWNGQVDITYSIVCDELDKEGKPKDVYVDFTGIDGGNAVRMKSLSGDGASAPVKAGGPYTVTWDASKDEPALKASAVESSAFQAKVHAMAGFGPYMVVNLETGEVRYSGTGPDLANDACRTTELWLRQIPAGTFTMGSLGNELGSNNETQHKVTLAQMFYIGVFECTQRQWELVTGERPSYFSNEDYYATRPVENVSYNDIRGSQAGAGWPAYGHVVDERSFLGKLRARTGLDFDLPTEAEWEYACRAEIMTALNSGKDLTSEDSCPNMAEVGRYWFNGGSGFTNSCTTMYGTAKVGSYIPNAWGLYDMHGNVYEWCLDWYAAKLGAAAVVNPQGALKGAYRSLRGGSWGSYARRCRSAARFGGPSHRGYYDGFRLSLPLQVR